MRHKGPMEIPQPGGKHRIVRLKQPVADSGSSDVISDEL